MSRIKDRMKKLANENAENQEQDQFSDEAFLQKIQELGFVLANPEQALRGQQWGKLGALDLLNTDNFFNELMSQPTKDAASQFVFQTIDMLDQNLSEFPQYNKLGTQTRNKLDFAFRKVRSVEQIAFTLSNFGLAGAGHKVGSLAEILKTAGISAETPLWKVLASENGRGVLEKIIKDVFNRVAANSDIKEDKE